VVGVSIPFSAGQRLKAPLGGRCFPQVRLLLKFLSLFQQGKDLKSIFFNGLRLLKFEFRSDFDL